MNKDRETGSIKEKLSPLFKKTKTRASRLTAYFKVEINIDSLVQVPYITGLYYCKWKLPSMTIHGTEESTSSKGTTIHSPVRSHIVTWEHSLNFHVSIPIDKEGELKPCVILLYVKQEWETTGKSERIGEISVNISEYATLNVSNVPQTLKTVLLEKSKTNAALRLYIRMEQYKSNVNEIVLFRPAKPDSIIKDKPIKLLTADNVMFSSSTIGDGELTMDSLQDVHLAQLQTKYPIYDGESQYSLLLAPQDSFERNSVSQIQYDDTFLSSDPLCLLLGPEAYLGALDQSKQLILHHMDT